VKLRVGKYSGVLGSDQGTTPGGIGVSKPSTPKLGEGKPAGKLPKFKLLEAPTDGVIGK
jgi:hypothetical protein